MRRFDIAVQFDITSNKRKRALEHAQNVQNPIILRMSSVIRAFALHACIL